MSLAESTQKHWGWERVAGWLLVVTAVVLGTTGAIQVARTPFLVDQLSYIMSGGIGGLICVVLGCGLIISADRHDEWRALNRIENLLRDRAEIVIDASPEAQTAQERPQHDILPSGDMCGLRLADGGRRQARARS